jgi:negative regulator of flagellin synthesis FlgM
MSNEIKGIGNGPPLRHTHGAKAESTNTAQTQAQAPSGASGEKVSLTDTMTRLRAIVEGLDDASIVDAGRVDALRDALARGDYRIDDQRVAEKLLALEQLLLPSGEADEQ